MACQWRNPGEGVGRTPAGFRRRWSSLLCEGPVRKMKSSSGLTCRVLLPAPQACCSFVHHNTSTCAPSSINFCTSAIYPKFVASCILPTHPMYTHTHTQASTLSPQVHHLMHPLPPIHSPLASTPTHSHPTTTPMHMPLTNPSPSPPAPTLTHFHPLSPHPQSPKVHHLHPLSPCTHSHPKLTLTLHPLSSHTCSP